ncbi:MAG: hypothetical protein KGL18_19445 [Burkholderiales bacterium]|nr:hypothetical protein [Burkholderiales bacterium]MDE1929222.1 hypothetical protein [Burkholderiales bacterium]MDE2159719.1 hypothetical protein [Burkholderiales bacterium]MDE2505146.1 hypothetical protein [Burkholderiales bacterium]
MSTPANLGLPLAAALDRSEPLTGLLRRLAESRARYEAIADLLPPGLRGDTRPGPLDETQWVLLVGHAAAAAKLRQLLPAFRQALLERGWSGPEIRIKVLPRP